MTIKRKASKQSIHIQSCIEDVINRGGTTSVDIDESSKEVRFSLRLPSDLIQKIDEARKLRVGIVSRNQWILEAISKTLE